MLGPGGVHQSRVAAVRTFLSLDTHSPKPYSQLIHLVELTISFSFISCPWKKDEDRSKTLKLISYRPLTSSPTHLVFSFMPLLKLDSMSLNAMSSMKHGISPSEKSCNSTIQWIRAALRSTVGKEQTS